MKKFFLSLAIMMIATLATFAQVPTVMMYQVQIIHGKEAYQDVSVEMQLRTSQNGSAIWSQTFNLTDVKNRSVQNLGLDFGDKINLDNGEYWLATIVDGEEKGCAKLTSVPYAMVAKKIEGVLTAEELVGTWESKYIEHDEGETLTSENYFTFCDDGTFTCSYKEWWNDATQNARTRDGSGTWAVTGSGNLYYSVNYVEREWGEVFNEYEEKVIPTFINRNEGKLVFGGGDNFFGDDLVLTKAKSETTR